MVEEREDCGFVYYGRHFRTRSGELPQARMNLIQHYDSVTVLTLPSDNGTWSVVFTPGLDAVVERLRDPAALTASLNLHRAILPPASLIGPPLRLPPVQAPSMGIWSSGDHALTEARYAPASLTVPDSSPACCSKAARVGPPAAGPGCRPPPSSGPNPPCGRLERSER